MKNVLIKILFIICIIYLISMYFLGINHGKKVLGIQKISTPAPSTQPIGSSTPNPTPIPTPTATPMPTSTHSPTPKPTPPVPTATSAEINGFIDRFSAQFGVDPNVLRYIAICESGFASNAKNGPYLGLYQFGEVTWKNIRKEFGEDTNPDLRYSAEESVQTAAYALSKGKGGIWPNCVP